MKSWLTLIAFFLLMIGADIGLNITYINKRDELYALQKVINAEQTAAIVELQKEVRILKTDVHILQYGFEEAE